MFPWLLQSCVQGIKECLLYTAHLKHALKEQRRLQKHPKCENVGKRIDEEILLYFVIHAVQATVKKYTFEEIPERLVFVMQ